MIRSLFSLYRKAPYSVREGMSRLTLPARMLLQPWNSITMDGYSMELDFSDNASFKYYVDKNRYEKLERKTFLSILAQNPGCYVIDIGAHYGAYTLASAAFAEWGSVKKVIAIEPDERPFKALQASIHKNRWEDSVSLHPVAVSDEPGTVKFFLNARSSADNRSHDITSANIRIKATREVECVRVEDLISRLGISFKERFVIKMDIQGNELRALKGMDSLLTQTSGFAIFFEFAPYLIRSAGGSVEKFIEWVNQRTFDKIFEFSSGSLIPIANQSDLIKRMKFLDGAQDARYGGATADFLVITDLNFGGDE